MDRFTVLIVRWHLPRMRDVPGSKPDHCDLQESIKLNLLSDPVPQYHSKCVA